MGLAQPLPTLVNLAEQQARWIAAYLKGEYVLPGAGEMEKAIAADEEREIGHYYTLAPAHDAGQFRPLLPGHQSRVEARPGPRRGQGLRPGPPARARAGALRQPTPSPAPTQPRGLIGLRHKS